MDSDITIEDARHVLWYFADRTNGWEYGTFTGKLISAIAHADQGNQERLRLGFPGLVAAARMCMYDQGGTHMLGQFVRGEL
ncbi:hypothetical protein [Lysinibacter cavernae]|uniref:Uncharacterized protein n=1 Tax=Lysinibacter cavernae TaxID=1640652 RepID=A0A7X5QYU2_9MICO|nr:hypothetical protein [Lysinibacter cavernae]NIH52515.1 hypothetical protein [Lysinibacter cavernae]